MAIEVPESLGQSSSSSNDNGNNDHRHRAIKSSSNGNSASTTESKRISDDSASNTPNAAAAYTAGGGGGAATTNSRQFLPVIGLFAFYVAHDALQERMFRFEGFEFGFFMTLVEVLVMLVGSIVSEGDYVGSGLCARPPFSGEGQVDDDKQRTRRRGGRKKALPAPVLVRIAWVGLFLALAHGLGNTSLNYSPYPLKVAFKSCKLVPTMALGACVTGRKHSALQYTAATVMGMGLAALTAADVFSTRQRVPLGHDGEWARELGPLVGPTLLTVSTVFDSIVPNLQERLLRIHGVKTSEMILVSNMVMCVVLVGYTTYSGELVSAWSYCASNLDASGVLLAQGLCAYLGLRSYLAIIRDHGGVIGVLLANARKIVTIVLSFLLFAKPFNERHFVGLVLVLVGVYLGYISKGKGGGKDEEASSIKGKGSARGRKRRKERRRKSVGSDDDELREHHV